MNGHELVGHGVHAAPPPSDSRHAEHARVRRSRRTRALLAGGIVLGIGAGVTLAAWNDSEFGTGSFEASVFHTESNSGDGSGWEDNASAPGASLTFSTAGMSPTVSNYAYLDIRTTSATTVAGSVVLDSSAKSGTLADALEYRAILTSAATTCAAAAFSGSPTWVAGDSTTYIAAAAMPSSPPSTSIAAGATETHRYCFEVRIVSGASTTLQGSTGTLTWGFLATSAS